MDLSDLDKLFQVAKRKNRIDKDSDWSQGSGTYFRALHSELNEVEEELAADSKTLLEEELGDVLWDYFNLLLCLQEEQRVDIDQVFATAVSKFNERVSGLEQGESWAAVKARQKLRHQSPED